MQEAQIISARELLRIQCEIALALSTAPDLAAGAAKLLEIACTIEGIDCGGLYLRDRSDAGLSLVVHRGLGGRFVAAVSRLDAESPKVRLVEEGAPFYGFYPGLSPDRRGPEVEEGLKAIAVVPIRHEQEIVGSLNLGSHAIDEIPIGTRSTLECLASELGILLSKKAAEEALRESEERYRLVFEKTSDAIVLWEEGGFFDCNSAFRALFGFAPGEDLRGMQPWELSPPFQPDGASSAEGCRDAARQAREKKFYRCQWVHRRRSGEDFDAEVWLTAILLHGRQVIQATIRDITALKRAQAALRSQIEFEELVAGISKRFINVPAAEIDEEIRRALHAVGAFQGVDRGYVFVFDDQGRRMSNSHEWCAEGVTSHIDRLQQMTVADFRLVEKTVLGGEVMYVPQTASLNEEFQAEKAELEREEIQSLIFVPMVYGGAVVGFIGFDAVKSVRSWSDDDVVRLKLLSEVFATALQRRADEIARQRMEEHLREVQKLESLGLMAGGIAHDLNNLLVGILGNASLALLELNPQSAAHRMVLDLQTAAQRAAELSGQMLDYAGKGALVFEPVDVAAAVQDMLGLMRSNVPGTVELVCRAGSEHAVTQGDITQIRQVIMNLVINAAEAIGSGPGSVSVSVETLPAAPPPPQGRVFLSDNLTDAGGWVALEVADTGCGMNAATLSSIFDPFFTTKATGRGLGLASVLGIVRGHSGAIAVNSKEEQGTVITVYFRLCQGALRKSAEPAAACGWRGHGTALVVDDDDLVLSVAAAMLEKLGFSVLKASGGKEALEIFRDRGPEIALAVLDLTMADLDGAETMRRLRELSRALPVILCSGYSESQVQENLILPEQVGFLHKPFAYEALCRAVRAVIEQPPVTQ